MSLERLLFELKGSLHLFIKGIFEGKSAYKSIDS